jgi:hypothetical protein
MQLLYLSRTHSGNGRSVQRDKRNGPFAYSYPMPAVAILVYDFAKSLPEFSCFLAVGRKGCVPLWAIR